MTKLFISYAHEDRDMVDALKKHLTMLLRQSLIETWYDNEIKAGEEWEEELIQKLETADIVLLLVSADFLSSDYCYSQEMERALKRHEERSAKVIPIIIRHVDWHSTPFGKLQVLPRNANPVEQWNSIDQALAHVATELRAIISDSESKSTEVHSNMSKAQIERRSHIIPKQMLAESSTRLPGEVFAIELLTKPIQLSRENGKVIVNIDRREVTECVISNAGKKEAVSRYMQGDVEKIIEEEISIQRFLNGTNSETHKEINLEDLNLRLRWASGGVLSVVTIEGKDYVPLMFRDIRPYGWNLALGATERHFNEDGVVKNMFPIEDEWDYPINCLKREFLEEFLVIDRDPDSGEFSSLKGFFNPKEFHIQEPSRADMTLSFAKTQATWREREDRINIGWHSAKRLNVQPGKGNARIAVCSDTNGREGRSIYPNEDVLVAFSLLDLGIEIVKVYKYELDPGDYILSGEVLQSSKGQELVRMPIVLFSCSYLAEIFGNNESWLHYTLGPAPSIAVQRKPKESEVRMFEWDVKRRTEIIKTRKASLKSQRLRFLDWYDKFGQNFLDRDGNPSTQNLTNLYVPGAAKLLNQYFSIAEVYEKYRVKS